MLDLLAGRKTIGVTGDVRLNGHLIRPEITSKYISYVAQVGLTVPAEWQAAQLLRVRARAMHCLHMLASPALVHAAKLPAACPDKPADSA